MEIPYAAGATRTPRASLPPAVSTLEDPDRDDDAALLAGLRARQPAAFERWVRREAGRLLGVARRLLRNEDDAREAVQEAFLSALRALPQFHGEARLSTWMHRIVVNAALMRLRTRRRKPEQPIEDLLPAFLADGHHAAHPCEWALSPEALLGREETRRLVREAIDHLPESARVVLVLRDVEELDTTTVAGLLGISAGAVKVRLHRARQALRALLDPHLRRGDL